MNARRLFDALAYLIACVGLGYAGFQIAGWTGAVALPLGATVAIAFLAAPVMVALVAVGIIIQLVRAGRRIREELSSWRTIND